MSQNGYGASGAATAGSDVEVTKDKYSEGWMLGGQASAINNGSQTEATKLHKNNSAEFETSLACHSRLFVHM